MKRNELILLLFFMGYYLADAQEGLISLEFSVPHVNKAVTIEGKTMASYELKLTNYSQYPARLKSIAMVHANSNETIFLLEGEELKTIMGQNGFNKNLSTIDSGNTGILFLDYILPFKPCIRIIP